MKWSKWANWWGRRPWSKWFLGLLGATLIVTAVAGDFLNRPSATSIGLHLEERGDEKPLMPEPPDGPKARSQPLPRLFFTDAALEDLKRLPSMAATLVMTGLNLDFWGGDHGRVSDPEGRYWWRRIGNTDHLVVYREMDRTTPEEPTGFVILRILSNFDLARHIPSVVARD
jgi:hypothetical protein